MNSLHTSLPQKTPVRGVVLHPLEETRGERTVLLAPMVQGATTTAIAQRRATLFARSMDALRKATRGEGMMPHVVAFFIALFAVLNMAQAATYYYIGSSPGVWNNMANWSLTAGGPGGAGVPGTSDIAIINGNRGDIDLQTNTTVGRLVVQAGSSIRFQRPNMTGNAILSIAGIAGDNTPPLLVQPTGVLVVGRFSQVRVQANPGAAPQGASIFGTIAAGDNDATVGQEGIIDNISGAAFRIQEGGVLSIRSLNAASTAALAALEYAMTGNRGTLEFNMSGTTAFTIPAAGVPPITTQLGNLVLNRPFGATNTLTAGTYDIGGTLEIRGNGGIAVLTVPNGTTINMTASRMLSGRIGTPLPPTVATAIRLVYQELGTPPTPFTSLAPTTSDIAFTTDAIPAATVTNWGVITGLRNNINSLNLTVNSNVQIAAATAPDGLIIDNGKITIPSAQTMWLGQIVYPVTVPPTFTLGGGSIANQPNTQLVVNGTFALATNSTLTNSNVRTGLDAGILVSNTPTPGEMQFWGSTLTGQISGAGNTFYVNNQTIARFIDVNQTNLVGTGPRTVNPQEVPPVMEGQIIVNRRVVDNQPSLDRDRIVFGNYGAFNSTVTLNGPINLTLGGLNVGGNRVIVNQPITSSAGGHIGGSDLLTGTGVFLYNATTPCTVSVTSSNFNAFNAFGVTNSGNLRLSGSTVRIEGGTAVPGFGAVGDNIAGRLQLSGTGNLELVSTTLRFSGTLLADPGNTLGQGGHIPITNTGAISSDAASNLEFRSDRIRSFPRFVAGGQNLSNLRVEPVAAPPAGIQDYLVSLRSPVTIANQLSLTNDAILQLAAGANLTLSFTIIGGAPNVNGNFIDVSQGGNLIMNSIAGTYTFPIGASFSGTAAAGIKSLYMPATITSGGGRQFTLSATSAITSVSVPSNLLNRSVQGTWSIAANPSYTGNLTLGWNQNTGAGIPAENAPLDFHNISSTVVGRPLTTMRRAFPSGTTPSTYVSVQSGAHTITPMAFAAGQQTIEGAITSAIGTTTERFIVTNALFPIYWVGAGNNWADINNWSATPNTGAGSANPPGINDWAYFNQGTANITMGIPAGGIQRMTIARLPVSMSDPNVTLAQPNQTLNLVQRVATAPTAANPGWFEESLHIGTNASLTLNGTSVFMNPSPTVGGEERTVVFGRMQLNSTSMFRNLAGAANNLIAFASGATLQIAGGGLDRGANSRLQYGTDDPAGTAITPSLQPFYRLAPTTPAIVLSYTDATGASVVVTPTVSNEFSSIDQVKNNSALPDPAKLDAKIVVNRTGINRDFRINNTAVPTTGFRFVGGGDLLSGNWEIPVVQKLYFGADPADNRDIPYNAPITVAAGSTFWGNDDGATEIFVQGRGASNLRFTDNNPYRRMLGALYVNIPSSAGTVTLNSSRNLTLTNPTGLNVFQGNGVQALTISPADTLTLASTVTNAKIGGPALPSLTNVGVLVQGRLRLGSAPSAAPHLATFNANSLEVRSIDGITVAPTGVLEIFGGVLTAPPTISPLASTVTRPVRYQASTSILRYSTTGNITTTDVEFPGVLNAPLGDNTLNSLNAILEIEKGFPQRVIAENLVTLNSDKSVIGTGQVRLLSGAVDLSNTNGRTMTINVPLISPSPLGMFRSTNATPAAFNDSRIEYNNSTPVTLRFDASVANTPAAPFNGPVMLGSLSITNASVTMASGTNASLRGLTAGPLAGQLALNGSAQLTLNSNMLRFAGDAVGVSGYISAASNLIIGDANASLEFVSMRGSTLRMGSGTGAQLRNLTVNSVGAISPTNVATVLVTMATSVSVQNELIMNAQSQSPLAGGGNIRLNNGIELFANATNANNTPTNTNAFIDATLGGRMRMPVAANAQRLFPVGVQNVTGSILYSPLIIFNSPTAADYTVSADSVMDFLQPAYPQRVIPEWTVTGGSGNRTVRFYWEQTHESTGFIRANSFVGAPGSGVYQSFGATAVQPASFQINGTGNYYYVDNTIPLVSLSGTKLLVLNQPIAIILAADSLNVSGNGGLNPTNPFGFSTANTNLASGVPFTVRFSSFNGLVPAQRSPVIAALNVQVQLIPTPGSGDIFTTTGTGSAGTPVNLLPIINPISGTTTDITFNWTNAGLKGSTTAILRFYDPSGTVTSATYPVIIFGPASTLAASTAANIGTALPGDISGFNVSGNPGGTVIESEKPFLLYAGSYNGLGQAAPVIAAVNFVAQVLPISGSPAVFTTTGTGSLGIPFTLVPGINPLSVTSTNLTVTWVNPGNLLSTDAIFRLYDATGQFASRDIMIKVNAPPLRGSTIAYSRVENSSTGTQGFNGGGLGQFNITGGVQFPVDFGFYSASNFLVATTAITQVTMSVVTLTPGAQFSVTNDIPSGRINPINVGPTVNGGTIRPIINWTNAGPSGGVVQALAILTANPGTPYAFSTSVVVNVGTGATVPVRLGYAVNSGDILDQVLGYSGVNGGNYTPATTTPIITGVPFPLNFASFADNGMVVRPSTPTQVQLSVASAVGTTANFALLDGGPTFIASTNGIGSLRPSVIWTNPGSVPSYGDAVLTLTAISGQTTLFTTTVSISVFTTGSVATAFAMSQSSSTGTQGVSINNNPERQGGTADPIRASSGTPFNVNYGFYNGWGIPTANYPANASFVITVTPPFGENVTLDGNTVTFIPFAVQRGTLSNITLNWRNPMGANPPPIDVNLRIDAPFANLSTNVTIRLSSSANAPAFLGLSQVSSTSSVGVNNGNLNLVSGVPFNVDAGLFDDQGSLTRSLTNISTILSVEDLAGNPSGSVTIVGNTGGVFVNQSGIRFNNIALNWNNPTSVPPTIQVRLRIRATAGGTVLSTFAIVTISAGNVFPRISNLTPSVGGQGTQVQITGVNFTGVNSVTFNGIPAQSFQVLGDGVILAVAPGGVSTGEVRVSRPAQGSIPAGNNTGQVPPAIFTTGLAPTITELVPPSGGIGSRVLIRGTNLFNVSDIRIADILAIVDPDPNLNNTTTGNFVWVQLTGPLLVTNGSLNVSRTGAVTMATLGGVITSTQLFTYNPPPIITSITPNTAVANGQSVSVIIRGTGFNFPLDPSQSSNVLVQQSGVYFNITNNPMAISPAQRVSVQSVTPTEIRATISGSFTNAQGQRYVYVQNQDGQYTFIPFQLTPNQPPVITGITPNITTATGVAFETIVSGSNFFGQSGLTVTARTATGQQFNLPFRALSSSQVAVTIPIELNSAAQNLTITLQNSDGQSANVGFIVRDPGRPQIVTVSPSRAVVGSSTMTVTISGFNFFLNAIPSLGITNLQVLSQSTNSIVAVIPANLLTTFGSPTISVRNPGSFSTSVFFPIGYPAPTVTSVVTASGPNQGQPVTAASIFPFQLAVNGTGFRIGVTATFNGQTVTVVSTSPTQVVVAVPSGLNTPGVFPVAVSNTDGQSASGLFTIGTPNGPVITAISPREEVAIGQPFVITLDGRNFSVNAQGQILAGTQVLFNGVPLAILSASSTRLQVQVPAGLNTREGNALIEVVNSDLQRTSIPLTVGCSICPIVRSFTPTTVRPTNNYGYDVTFTFRGSNLSPNSTITIGGSPLRIVSGSDSVITAIAPPGFFFGDGRIVVTNPDGRRFTVTAPSLAVGVSNVVTTPLAGRAYPNPVDDMLSFETDITSTTLLRVRLSDMLGRTVTSFEQQVQRGRFLHQLDVSGLSAGVYIFEMSDGQRRFTEKIIKR